MLFFFYSFFSVSFPFGWWRERGKITPTYSRYQSIFRYTWDHVNNKSTTCRPPSSSHKATHTSPSSSIITFFLSLSQVLFYLPLQNVVVCLVLFWISRIFIYSLASARRFSSIIFSSLLPSPLPFYLSPIFTSTPSPHNSLTRVF